MGHEEDKGRWLVDGARHGVTTFIYHFTRWMCEKINTFTLYDYYANVIVREMMKKALPSVIKYACCTTIFTILI